ncbi:MAG: septal ring lytic transglycosylase RlpA family protein [Persicimonas sp.]
MRNERVANLLILLVCAALLGACAGSKKSSYDDDKIRDPDGALNTDRTTRSPDGKERELSGEASWYGEDFHGRQTACGEPYDMYAFTAAHKTLPFHTIVRVIEPETRKSVVVRINDRGPYSDGRIIDLSYAAARDLDLTGAGVQHVELEVVEWGDGSRRHAEFDQSD